MKDEERWQQVRDLFERAFDEKPPDVEAWLDREGISDWQLREEVVSLMRHHAGAGSFLVDAAGDRLPAFMADGRQLEPGQVLGPYTIVREIGGGGQGRVYLANDARLSRMVALKALAPDLTADPSHRERLRREARAAAALTHPGICTIYALEEFDGELYIASEFIDGHTLREEIKGTRPPAHEVVHLAQELANALGGAHESGITHRDLKPENVMRTADGRLKIVDFGLARVETPFGGVEELVTRQGAFMGTPAYMAPEQLKGQRADARTDVWALGVLTYEYACGAHPFDAATMPERIGRILEDDIDPIESRRSDLPPSLVEVIERCLSKSPADRFATAGEIVRALNRRDKRSGRMAGWWRTHQLAVVAMYFVACALTWQIKEWQPGVATPIFLAVGVAAAVAGILRGHLLFTERVNASRLAAEHARALTTVLVADLLLAAALAVDGVLLAAVRPVAGVLTIFLGVGIALARLVMEPATTSASFK